MLSINHRSFMYLCNMSEPLAERMRPRTLDEYVGQQHLVGEGAVLRKMIDAGRVSSFILWGPPGVGKTTLAQIIANKLETPFYTLSVVTLIGATTENPSFEVIRPLLSRCQLYVLKSLEKEDLLSLLERAVTQDVELRKKHILLKETGAILRYSGGDARKLLNILELAVESANSETIEITDEVVVNRLQQNPLAYDKDGEMHYDIISAFIKSIRGSDPDAALYWMARMIEGGEDPQFIARRLVISAAEDIGLANPNALLLANAAFDAVMKIGWPEGRIPLAEAAVYLATSPKSNSAYLGIDTALGIVKETGNQPVPLHLRNAPTQLMKQLGYHDGYKYSHDFPDHFVVQQYMPDDLQDIRIWHPQHSPSEEKLFQQMRRCWGDRFNE